MCTMVCTVKIPTDGTRCDSMGFNGQSDRVLECHDDILALILSHGTLSLCVMTKEHTSDNITLDDYHLEQCKL